MQHYKMELNLFGKWHVYNEWMTCDEMLRFCIDNTWTHFQATPVNEHFQPIGEMCVINLEWHQLI